MLHTNFSGNFLWEQGEIVIIFTFVLPLSLSKMSKIAAQNVISTFYEVKLFLASVIFKYLLLSISS